MRDSVSKQWLLICFLAMGAAQVWCAESPAISLRVNGRGSGAEAPMELWRGEPVIVEVVLRRAGRSAGTEPLVLEPPDGGWATRIKVAVTDPAGAAVTWPMAVTGNPSGGALALQPNGVTTLVLRMPPAAREAIVKGNYSMVARLDLPDGKAWRGSVASAPVAMQVVDAPESPRDAALGRRQLLRVNDALLAGEIDRAQQAMDDMLRADAARPEGFVAMALIAEARGERELALVAIDLAIARAAAPAGARVEWPLPGTKAPAKPAAPTRAPPDRETPAPAGAATAAPAALRPRPVPLEYYDLRQRFEKLPPKAADGREK